MLSTLLGFLAEAFNAIISMLDFVVSLVLQVIVFVLDIIALVNHSMGLGMLNLLPNMPTELGGAMDFSGLAFANNYLPISEAVALLPVWAYIYCGIGCYKFFRLIKW